MPSPQEEEDGYSRTGRVFALRITDEERALLEMKERQSRQTREPDRGTDEGRGRAKASLGSYIVWAALQWTPIPDEPLPVRRRTKPKPPNRGKKKPRPKPKKPKPKPKPKPKKKGGRRGR